MTIREQLFDELVGDLEYHPKRGLLYLSLGAASLSAWIFAPAGTGFTSVPLVFALGSLALLIKGVFLLRKTSEGLGITQLEFTQLSVPSTRKALPSILVTGARVLQDFGAGSMLLWPVLQAFQRVNESRPLPILRVFLIGTALFCAGWGVRRLNSPDQAASH